MKKVMIVLGVVVILVSSMMMGCEKAEGEKNKEDGKEKTIAGKWKEVGGIQTIEFFKEGTVVVVDKGDPPLAGDYRFIDDNRIRMDLKGLGELLGPVVAEISVPRNEITLVNPAGEIEVYKKFEDSKTGKEKLLSEQKEEEHKLSEKEIRLLGKYVGQSEEVFQMFLELKGDGTALINSSPIFGWEVIWEPKDDSRYSPTLILLLYASNGSLTYHAGDRKKAIKILDDFGSFRVDYWHGLRKEVLVRQQEANLIKLSKVKVWDTGGRTICPGEVKIWDRYVNTEDQKTVLQLKRIPNFIPPGWKRFTGCDGLCLFYSAIEWEFDGNRVKINTGGEKPIELEIKGTTLLDRQNNITFVKQNDDFQFPIFAEELFKQNSMVKKEKIDQFSDETLWVKCRDPDCGAEYQMSKKECFKYIEEHADPMALTAPAMICEKCGEQSVYRAEKCGNPDCGLIFFRGSVPNDFPDRCPKCGYSVTEEQRKARRSTISSSPISSPSETTDLSSTRRSRRVRRR